MEHIGKIVAKDEGTVGGACPYIKFGRELRKMREKAGIPQYEAARLLGVSHSYVCRMECGNRFPSMSVARRMEKVFGPHLPKGFLKRIADWRFSEERKPKDATPFGERLFELRIRFGLSRYELGKRSGTGAALIWRLEQGSAPSGKVLDRIVDAFASIGVEEPELADIKLLGKKVSELHYKERHKDGLRPFPWELFKTRTRYGFLVCDLADAAGMARSCYSKIENGNLWTTPRSLERIISGYERLLSGHPEFEEVKRSLTSAWKTENESGRDETGGDGKLSFGSELRVMRSKIGMDRHAFAKELGVSVSMLGYLEGLLRIPNPDGATMVKVRKRMDELKNRGHEPARRNLCRDESGFVPKSERPDAESGDTGFGECLKRLRKRLGISQNELIELLNGSLSKAYLFELERGKAPKRWLMDKLVPTLRRRGASEQELEELREGAQISAERSYIERHEKTLSPFGLELYKIRTQYGFKSDAVARVAGMKSCNYSRRESGTLRFSARSCERIVRGMDVLLAGSPDRDAVRQRLESALEAERFAARRPLFAGALRELRKKLGMTREELAEALGISLFKLGTMERLIQYPRWSDNFVSPILKKMEELQNASDLQYEEVLEISYRKRHENGVRPLGLELFLIRSQRNFSAPVLAKALGISTNGYYNFESGNVKIRKDQFDAIRNLYKSLLSDRAERADTDRRLEEAWKKELELYEAPSFGDRMRELRAKLGLSQGELAERAGVPKQVVSKMERFVHPPSEKSKIWRVKTMLEKLAGTLSRYDETGKES